MVVVASVLLGAVFLVSGVMKVAAPTQWHTQSADLGVPRLVAMVMPFIELVVGTLLVAQIARRPVAVIAGAMLMAFTTLLVVRLLQGRRPPCACFGAWTTKPIGWGNVVRNTGFLALAVAVAVRLG
ncbi:MAG: DoxX family membrane protein [Actinomycetota bacterium]|nr:DoxX family membrane protein [Actinomycetota bacterium]